MTVEMAHELPVACTLTEAELRSRGDIVTPLFARAEEVCELEDGYAFRFPATPENAAELLDFALFESRCCAFLSYELIFDPGHGPLWLQLRGSSPGAKEFAAGFVRHSKRVTRTATRCSA
jgi:hypothetical protein